MHAWPLYVIGAVAEFSGIVCLGFPEQVGDRDEHRRAICVRWTVERNDRYRHLELPDDLFAAVLATLPAREDGEPEAPLFPDLDEAALRTAITRAC